MTEMIAYCGLNCTECDAFKATQAGDLDSKIQIAERWTKDLNMRMTPDDVTCDGCKSERISAWCQKVCEIRPCAEAKGVNTCAHCDDYMCDKLETFLQDEPEGKENLEAIRKNI